MRLEEVVNRASSLLNVRLARPDEKESHPGKKLSKHVEECLELSSFIVDVFEMGEDARKFSSLLCELHDIGKLHPDWSFGARGFSHSKDGAEILKKLFHMGYLDLGLGERLTWILISMVRNHHSSLKFEGYKEHGEYKKLSFEEALLYADSFGAFKLADFSSANDLIDEVREHLRVGWPDEDTLISSLYGSKRRPGEREPIGVDRERLELQRKAAIGNLTLSAPTGWGKTMVGLLRAVNERPVKLFYCLPTITAIRKMREDFERVFGSESVGEYFYFADFDILRERGEEEFELDLYRFFVPRINITTVDQLLLTMMRAGKYHFRRFEFRKSLIVIDEYHLLPPAMFGALVEVLSRYSKPYNMGLLLMTATPLETYRRTLKESLALKEIDLSSEYSKLRRHKIEMMNSDGALSKVRELLEDGRRVLVILNTVDRAINFYRELDSEGKLLIHSRFTVRDRYDKEKEIDSCRVLVATQVAEVSLDVSFDALVSDMAPLPAIIQRAGRVNRYGRRVDGTNVYLIEDVDSKPYGELEVRHSLKVIGDGLEELERYGELAYLRMLANYDSAIRVDLEDRIERARRLVAEKVFQGEQLSSKRIDEEDLSKVLRGEVSVLTLPRAYVEEVRGLISKLRNAKSYPDRRRIRSEIKGYLVPLSIRLRELSSLGHEEGIPFPVAEHTYDRELGLLLD